MENIKIEHSLHAKALRFLNYLREQAGESKRISFTMQDFCDVIDSSSDSVWAEFYLTVDYLSECHIVGKAKKPVFAEYHIDSYDKVTVKLNV